MKQDTTPLEAALERRVDGEGTLRIDGYRSLKAQFTVTGSVVAHCRTGPRDTESYRVENFLADDLLPVLDEIAVPTRGRPGSRPAVLIADKAYSHPSTRTALRRRRIRTVIPQRSDQTAHRAARGSRGGRPPAFDAETYKGRNVVERAFGRLKQWRGIATRYDKHARNYRAGIVLGATVLFWLR